LDLKKNVITFTTDFGNKDYFTGAMKGVILGINPDAKFVDISHEVQSHDLWGASYLLDAASRFFPQYTIHVAVVDPGVGSERRPIIAVTDKHYFIAPDNGLLSFIYKDPGFSRVIHITADHYFLPVIGSTFHARDIFAPVAAWLSKGVEADKFGEEITDFNRFGIPSPRTESNVLTGEVVYIDKFGNCITNVSFEDIRQYVEKTGTESYRMMFKEKVVETLSPYYSSLKQGEPGIVVNGNGYLEIYVNQGDARRMLELKRGEKIQVNFG